MFSSYVFNSYLTDSNWFLGHEVCEMHSVLLPLSIVIIKRHTEKLEYTKSKEFCLLGGPCDIYFILFRNCFHAISEENQLCFLSDSVLTNSKKFNTIRDWWNVSVSGNQRKSTTKHSTGNRAFRPRTTKLNGRLGPFWDNSPKVTVTSYTFNI